MNKINTFIILYLKSKIFKYHIIDYISQFISNLLLKHNEIINTFYLQINDTNVNKYNFVNIWDLAKSNEAYRFFLSFCIEDDYVRFLNLTRNRKIEKFVAR
jgi:hypothetical protein